MAGDIAPPEPDPGSSARPWIGSRCPERRGVRAVSGTIRAGTKGATIRAGTKGATIGAGRTDSAAPEDLPPCCNAVPADPSPGRNAFPRGHRREAQRRGFAPGQVRSCFVFKQVAD
jgi:hypothetical protein